MTTADLVATDTLTSAHRGVASRPARAAQRFRMIDGLRGIAAFSVVIYHFNGAIARTTPDWLLSWMVPIANHGFLGVEIFFVISGFVIAYSVRDGEYTARYLGLFALRRSIRLDPVYWVAIGVQLALIAVGTRLFALTTPFPTGPAIASHFFYVQDFLGYGTISSVFWTLCFEIQFYLLFVGLLVVWSRAKDILPTYTHRVVITVALVSLFLVSLLLRYGGVTFVRGLALERWFQFFLGVLTWWVISGKVSVSILVGAYAAVLVAIALFGDSLVQVLPVLVSASIVVVGLRGKLDVVFSNRPLQFLGAISYSLYLLHGPIGERWISLVQRMVGPSFGLVWAWVAFASACAVSILASALIWRAIEVPTMRWSKRIRLPTRRLSAETTQPVGGVAAVGAPLGEHDPRRSLRAVPSLRI